MTTTRREFLTWFAALSTWPLAKAAMPNPEVSTGAPKNYAPTFLHPNDRWVFLPRAGAEVLELWDLRDGSRVQSISSKAANYLIEDRYQRELVSEFSPEGDSVFVSYIGYHSAWMGHVGLKDSDRHEIKGEQAENINLRDILRLGLRRRLKPKQLFQKELKTPSWLPGEETEKYWSVALSPSGTRALVVRREPNQGHRLVVYEVSTGRVLGQCPLETGADAKPAAFSLDEKGVVFSSSRSVWAWAWKDAKPPTRLKRFTDPPVDLGKPGKGSYPVQKEVSAVFYLQPGKALITLKTQTGFTQSSIQLGSTILMEVPGGRELVPPIASPQPVDLAVTRDGATLVARYGAGTIRSYDLASGRMTRLLTAFMPHSALLAFGPSADHLLAARPGGQINVWHRRGPVIKIHGSLSEEWLKCPPVVELDQDTKALAWNAQGNLFAAGQANGKIHIYDSAPHLKPSNWQRKATELEKNQGSGNTPAVPFVEIGKEGSPIRSLAFHPREARLCVLSAEGIVQTWALGSKVQTSTWQAHAQRANTLAFTPTGDALVTGGQDGATLWDPTGKTLRHFDASSHEVSGLSISPDGNLLAAACLDGVVRVWDLSTGSLKWKAEAHGGWAAVVAFSPDGSKLASGGEDGRVHFWSPTQGQRIASGKAHGHALAWSRDGAWLACNGLDRVRVLTSDLTYTDQDSNRLFLDWADEFT